MNKFYFIVFTNKKTVTLYYPDCNYFIIYVYIIYVSEIKSNKAKIKSNKV